MGARTGVGSGMKAEPEGADGLRGQPGIQGEAVPLGTVRPLHIAPSETTVRVVAPGGVRRRLRPLAPVLAGAVLALASSATVWADSWYEHYERAEQALRTEDWTTAVEQLNQAIERRGDSGARVRTYGMKFIEYFPYLRLGIAYHHLGQFGAALQAFETEARLGAVQASAGALEELRRYRDLTRQVQADLAEAEKQRIARIVQDSLREARDLEGQGRLDEAMSVLGRGLAVAPDDPQAQSALERIRKAVAGQQAEAQVDVAVARLVEQGRTLLEAGRHGEASTAFKEALSLKPSVAVQSLLARAESALRLEVQRATDAGGRASQIASRMDRARELQSAGDPDQALEILQSVLALDASNAEASELQSRLLAARVRQVQEGRRLELIQELLDEAEAEFTAGRYETSLAAANRALATDPGNAAAIQHLGRAYARISRGLLGRAPVGNIPPAIRFSDFREEQDDGLQVQIVRIPGFQLTGVVIDDSPVKVSCRDQRNRELEPTTSSQALGEYYVTEFRMSDDLPPGLSLYRLVATDQEGLVSSSEYTVLYARPFHRSPAGYALAVVIPLGAGAWLYVRRTRRRTRLLGRRFNPYVAGAPILGDDLFFGRERLLDRVLQTLPNNSLLLYGERRIGKTSVLHHLKKRLQDLQDPDYAFFPVYVDLQGTPEEKFFATLADDLFHQLGPVLDGLKPSASPGGDTEYAYPEFVRDVRQVIKVLGKKTPRQVRLVLLMDEVDELNAYDPRINQQLRSLFMRSFAENLVSVVSGVEIRKHWDRAGSPWYNFFEEIEVEPFRPEDARALIERPIRGVFKFEDGVVDRIVGLTEAKPYLIQRMCVALVSRLHEERRRTITMADVEAVGRPTES